jgi:hypothetical protein
LTSLTGLFAVSNQIFLKVFQMLISNKSARADVARSRPDYTPQEGETVGYLGYILCHPTGNSSGSVVQIVHDADAVADTARMEALVRAAIPDNEERVRDELSSVFGMAILDGQSRAAMACVSALHKLAGFPTGMLLVFHLTEEDILNPKKPITLGYSFDRTVAEQGALLNTSIQTILGGRMH